MSTAVWHNSMYTFPGHVQDGGGRVRCDGHVATGPVGDERCSDAARVVGCLSDVTPEQGDVGVSTGQHVVTHVSPRAALNGSGGVVGVRTSRNPVGEP